MIAGKNRRPRNEQATKYLTMDLTMKLFLKVAHGREGENEAFRG